MYTCTYVGAYTPDESYRTCRLYACTCTRWYVLYAQDTSTISSHRPQLATIRAGRGHASRLAGRGARAGEAA